MLDYFVLMIGKNINVWLQHYNYVERVRQSKSKSFNHLNSKYHRWIHLFEDVKLIQKYYSYYKHINAFSSYSAKNKRDGQTDGQINRRTGGIAISPVPGPMARWEIKKIMYKD